MKSGKVWGRTALLLANSQVELHEIHVNGGAKCSPHEHRNKWNAFYVISGSIQIHTKQKAYKLTDITLLEPGQLHAVAPGLVHWFEALEDSNVLELYWAAPLDPSDIIRYGKGRA